MTTDVWALVADAFDPPAPPPPLYVWECDRPDCDGAPHDDRPYSHARTKQRLPEGDWFIWLLLCGRGWGKTRTGSEAFLDMVLAHPVDTEGRATEWLIAGPNYDDTVKLLFEGVSSLKHSLARRGITYTWNKNDKLITLAGGQRIIMSHAEDEDLGRGGNWAGVWLDELGMYKRIKTAWYESLLPSVRALIPGWTPRIMVTTTPKVARKDAWVILRELTTTTDGSVVVANGSTFENEQNIPAPILARWRKLYPVGTRRYRQELLAELTDEVEGALFDLAHIGEARVTTAPAALSRVVVGYDPATTFTDTSDETGIVAVGTAPGGKDGQQFYVIGDASGRHGSPEGATAALVRLCAQVPADPTDAAQLQSATAGAVLGAFVLIEEMRADGCPVHDAPPPEPTVVDQVMAGMTAEQVAAMVAAVAASGGE